jgi:hypothetical protein
MLDNLTGGYNIATMLTLKLKYNEMMGFTQEEVEWLMTETGVNPEHIRVDMEAYYSGYLFHEEGKHRVYNPAMVLYFFNRVLEEGKPPVDLIDQNLKTNYGRLQKLVQNGRNRDMLIQIMKEDGVMAEIVQQFPIDMLHDDDYFVSLLFYMGLLTIKRTYMHHLELGIPNYSIRTLYWEITEIVG